MRDPEARLHCIKNLQCVFSASRLIQNIMQRTSERPLGEGNTKHNLPQDTKERISKEPVQICQEISSLAICE